MRREGAENHTLRGDQSIPGLFSLEKWQLGSGGLGRVDMVAPFKYLKSSWRYREEIDLESVRRTEQPIGVSGGEASYD